MCVARHLFGTASPTVDRLVRQILFARPPESNVEAHSRTARSVRAVLNSCQTPTRLGSAVVPSRGFVSSVEKEHGASAHLAAS